MSWFSSSLEVGDSKLQGGLDWRARPDIKVGRKLKQLELTFDDAVEESKVVVDQDVSHERNDMELEDIDWMMEYEEKDEPDEANYEVWLENELSSMDVDGGQLT